MKTRPTPATPPSGTGSNEPGWVLLLYFIQRKYEKGSEEPFAKFCPSTAAADPNTEATCPNSASQLRHSLLPLP
uniref:Uncharacterized protein n=1 Tax=Leersia perrieri TaxID=77586 RepID=A0A0D9XPK5_9ORYZ